MILFVLGTRAEIIKCFPVMRELDKKNINWEWIHTGQHNLEELREDLAVKPALQQIGSLKFSQGSFRGNFAISIVKASLWSLKNL